MALETRSPQELMRLAQEIVGQDEIGGFTFNDDLSSLRAVVFKDGQIFEHVYQRDEQGGEYTLVHMSCTGRLSL